MTITYLTRLKSNLQHRLSFKASPLFVSSKPPPCLLPLSSDSSATNRASSSKEESLTYLLKKCSVVKDLKQIHAHIIQAGFDQNLYVIGKFIVSFVASEPEYMDYAVSVFARIQIPDGFLWNTMIRGFGKSSEPEKAFVYYKRMRERDLVPDNFTYAFLVKVCSQLGSVLLGKQIHCGILRHGFQSHVFVRNNLIHMYGAFKDAEKSRQLFEEIPSPQLVAWNTIIDCHVYCGKCTEALEFFSRMWRSGMEPDQATLVVTLSACSSLGALDFGRWVHHHCVSNSDLGSTLKVNNALIDMYAKCGAVEEAHEIFSRMSKKNIVTWNTMIFGLATHGYANKAIALFSLMLDQELVAPDGATFLGVFSACSHGGMVDQGRRFFNDMSKYHIQPTIKHYGSMVDILGRAGLLEEAYQLIRSMPMERNAIIWRTLLAACNWHGDVELGKQVSKHLLELESDHSSDYVLLANMYGSAEKQNEVMRVRTSMKKRGVHKPEPGASSVSIHDTVGGKDAVKRTNIYG